MSEHLYFAYGSNINLTQMAFRCPDAEVVGPALLTDYKLAFRSGSGVATIIPTQGQPVHGLLWNLTPACEESLDQYEGYPRFYYKDSVIVTDNLGNRHTVMAYIMAREFEREPTLPSNSYYMGIAEGYDMELQRKETKEFLDDLTRGPDITGLWWRPCGVGRWY